MKKIIFGLFTLAIATVNAQEKATPVMPPTPAAQTPAPAQVSPMQRQQAGGVTAEDRTEKMITRMTQELTLTPEQQPKVKQLILKREQDKDANRKKMDVVREENKKILESFDTDLKKLLTPEQTTKMNSKHGRMLPGQEGNKNAPPPVAAPVAPGAPPVNEPK